MRTLLTIISVIAVAGLVQICNPAELTAQSVTLYNLENSAYPLVRANLMALDVSGKRVTNLKPSDFELKEDGYLKPITFLSCPASKPPEPISGVLVFDVSGSMFDSGLTLAQKAGYTWVNQLPSGKSDCAITSFSDNSYINQDFTTDKTVLLKAIDELKTMGGTFYNEAFLNPYTGAISVARSGKNRRVIVFLTDGRPLDNVNTAEIISRAKNDGIYIYCVTIGFPAPQCLKDISSGTGAQCFENIMTKDDAERIYSLILCLAQDIEPCSIEWNSGTPCLKDWVINVELTEKSFGVSSKTGYKPPAGAKVASLEFIPSVVRFRNPVIGKNNDTIIKVRANNSDFKVSSVISSNPAFTITPDKFSLSDGKTIDLKVSYLPSDSNYNFSKFNFQTDGCSATYYASAYFMGKKSLTTTLKVTHPNGGERLVAGSDTAISWEGILPEDCVKIEYSTNNGASYNTISTNASHYSCPWKKIPPVPSDKCLVRISQANMNLNRTSGSLLYDYNDKANNARAYWSPDGRTIAVAFKEIITLWDTESGQQTGQFTGHSTTVNNIAWSPDGKRVASLDNSFRFLVWDPDTKKTLLNLTDLNAWSFAWSPEGGRFVTSSGKNEDNAKIIDANSGSVILTFGQIYLGQNYLVWSPDGRRVAQSPGSRILDPETGNLIFDFSSTGGYISWCQDGSRLMAGSRLRDAQTYNILNSFPLGYRGKAVWSPDGNSIATTDGDIWDSRTYQSIGKMIGHDTIISDIEFSPDGYYIATSSLDQTAKIWDASNGTLLYDLTGHTDKVLTVDWSPFGGLVATSSEDSTAKIWYIGDGREVQQDVSDAVFSIVMPKPAAMDIDMKQCPTGSSKDSVVSGFINNAGSYDFRVDTMFFTGADAACFGLVSFIPPYQVAPDKPMPAEFRFTPSRVGQHKARIVIVTQADTVVKNITGTGVVSTISALENFIDFGRVQVGSHKDTLRVITIKNLASMPKTITKIKHGKPNDIDFTTISGSAPITLQPGDTCRLDLRFSPQSAGRTSGTLEFHYSGTGSPAIVQLFGEGVALPSQAAVLESLIDFGKVIVGDYKDTLKAVTIKNVGSSPLLITRTKHGAPNDIDFTTIDGAGPFTLGPGDTARLGLRFTPRAAGITNGTLEFHYDGAGSPAIIDLTGEGTADTRASLSIVDSLIDFGQVYTGSYKDSTEAVTIKNTGPAPLLITTTRHNSPNDTDFTTTKGAGPFTLGPGDTARMDLRFAPSATGKTEGTLEFHYAGPASPAVIRLKGEGIKAKSPVIQAVIHSMDGLVCQAFSSGTLEISNRGGASPLVVSGIDLTGADKDDFRLDFNTALKVEPDSTAYVNYRFIPRSTGLKSAWLVIHSNAGPDSVKTVGLSARKDSASIFARYTTVDLGMILVNSPVDTVLDIVNTGTVDNKALISGLPSFETDKQSLLIKPSETGNLKIHYPGSAAPQNIAETLILTDTACGRDQKIDIRLAVSTVLPSASLLVKSIEAFAGDTVILPVILDRQENLEAAGITGLSASLTYNSTMLSPLDYQPTSVSESLSSIAIGNMPVNIDIGSAIALIRFIAGLGNADSCKLELMDARTDGIQAKIDVTGGVFRLSGICREGGHRLVNPNGKPNSLFVRPNPSGEGKAEVTYETGSDNYVTVFISNILGERVYTVFDEYKRAGTYTQAVDMKEFPSGTYFVILKSGTDAMSIKLEVVK